MFLHRWRKPFIPKPFPEITGNDSIVLAYHPEVRRIGQSVLDADGNAFDAFIAAVAAEYVLAEGANSLAGPLGALLYVARDREAVYLDADFNDPLDRSWTWQPKMPIGARVLVPGAPAGLEALARRYATRSLRELLMPAIQLAADGFPVNRLMAASIASRGKILRRSAYGRATFFSPRGRPLSSGSHLRLPAVAAFLDELASCGAAHSYTGSWSRRFLLTVKQQGGVLTQKDLDQYTVRWEHPRRVSYRDSEILSASGRAYGSMWVLVALKTLEHSTVPASSHYTSDHQKLENLVRIAQQVWAEAWLLDPHVLDDQTQSEARLTGDFSRDIWQRVLDRKPFAGIATGGIATRASHSYHVIVADRQGNVASGTTTIEADPWSDGLFVDGIPLSSAGSIPWNTAPGERRLSPFSIHFTMQGEELRYAVGGISNSAAEFAFQVLVNLIDHGVGPSEAVTLPRFGTFPMRRKLDIRRNWLDPRISWGAVRQLGRRGLKFENGGVVDTGMGAAMMRQNRHCIGALATLPRLADPFCVDAQGARR